MLERQDKVAALVICYVDEASTFGMPSKMGVVTCMSFGFGLGRRKPSAATLILCRCELFTLTTHLGARKVLEIGV